MPASSGVVFVEPANGGESPTKKSSRSLTSFFSGKFSWMSRKDDSTQPRLTGKNSSWEAAKAIQHEEDEPSHLFDSPLQMSLHLLDGLQERLLEQSLRGEAKVVGKVMELLHSPDLMQSKPMQELIDDGKISDGSLKRVLVHAIAADEVMQKLSVMSKLNADWEFLTELRNDGRDYASRWLETTFERVGNESTIDVREAYL